MSRSPECHSRRVIEDNSRQSFCAHPRVHARNQLVTAEMCRICELRKQPPPESFRPFPPRRGSPTGQPCFYLGEQTGLTECHTCRGSVKLKTYQCRHALHGETTLRDCERCADFEPLLPTGTVRQWAVGMTTAPRTESTMERSLRSVSAAGWNEIQIFAEPGSVIPPETAGLCVTHRAETMGVLGNWFLGLTELVQRKPDADAYVMLQDDVVLAKNVRQYLESTLWPSERVGLVSVYCPEPYRQKTGFHEVNSNKGLLGALTWILPPGTAKWLVTAGLAAYLRQRTLTRETRRLDVLIGNVLAQAGWPAYYAAPSLAEHIGTHSTLWPGIGESPRRRAADFVGEPFDARNLLVDSDRPPRAEINPNPQPIFS